MSKQNIRCLVLTVSVGKILLPASTVAEVLKTKQIEPVPAHKQAWLAGVLPWRNHSIVVVHWDKLSGLAVGQDAAYEDQHVVVLYGLQLGDTVPFYAVVCAEMPDTAIVQEEHLGKFSDNKRPGLLGTVTLQDEKIWLPDLDYLENLIAQSEVLASGVLT